MPSIEMTDRMCELQSSRVRRLRVAVLLLTASACVERVGEQPAAEEWTRYELQQLDGERLPATLDDVRRDGARCTATTYAASFELGPTQWRQREEISSTCAKTPGDDKRRVVQDSGVLRREGEQLTLLRFDTTLQRNLELPAGRLVGDSLIFSDGVPEAIYVRIPK